MTPRPILFIDRDGTLIAEPEDQQVDALDKVRFLPGVFRGLGRLARTGDYRLVLVSNQDGLGTPAFPLTDFESPHRFVMEALAGEGIRFEAEHIDPTLPGDGADTRKPGLGMLGAYLDGSADLARSWVIGDRDTDVALARNLGARAIRLDPAAPAGGGASPDGRVWTVRDWTEAERVLRREGRRVCRRRRTLETDVTVDLVAEGTGRADVDTGVGFYDHLLEQVARHGGLDLVIRCRGDRWVDEHHTVEDVALAFGEALREALGNGRGLARYGFTLPMDEVLASAALDLGGRPGLVFRAAFTRERVGDLPTELVEHAFRSLADAARCTLHLEAGPGNDHHAIEGLFKAFGRTLRQALRRDPDDDAIPSTKGNL